MIGEVMAFPESTLSTFKALSIPSLIQKEVNPPFLFELNSKLALMGGNGLGGIVDSLHLRKDPLRW
jgi:hypothetical protein